MSSQKIIASVILVVAVVGSIVYLNSKKAPRESGIESVSVAPRLSSDSEEKQSTSSEEKTPSIQKVKKYPLAKEITTPNGFINTDGVPVTISEFVGKKVILIDFWTYSCINCQRTTPYLNAWYEKYKDKGLVIIGIHTPEFEFEKKYENVLDATEKMGIKFPVVLDNDFSTWNAYQNRFWPRKYLIDIDGYIVYDHIGEGGYEETEKRIQEALSERMSVLGESGDINQSVTKETSIQNVPRSPETYFGSARNFQQRNLLFPYDHWSITAEYAQNISSGASIVHVYVAKDLFFVAQADTETVVEILIDDKPIEKNAGADIIKTSDGKTTVKVKEARLYKIIEGDKSETHTIKFIIQKPGLKAFTFTFG